MPDGSDPSTRLTRDAQQRCNAVIGTRPPNAPDRTRLRLVTRFLPAPLYRAAASCPAHLADPGYDGAPIGILIPVRQPPGGLAGGHQHDRPHAVSCFRRSPAARPGRSDPGSPWPRAGPGRRGSHRVKDTLCEALSALNDRGAVADVPGEHPGRHDGRAPAVGETRRIWGRSGGASPVRGRGAL